MDGQELHHRANYNYNYNYNHGLLSSIGCEAKLRVIAAEVLELKAAA